MSAPGWIERGLGAAGRRARLTTSQAYTVATGVLLCAVLSAFGLPPVFRDVVDRTTPFAEPSVERTDADSPIDTATPPPSSSVPSTTTPDPVPGPAAPGEGPDVTPTSPVTSGPGPAGSTPPPLPGLDDVGRIEVVADLERPGAPGAVAVADDGTIYLATDAIDVAGLSGTPSTIVAVSPEGEITDEWELTGQPALRTRGISGLAADGERIVAVDASRSRLLFLDPSTGALTDGPRIPNLSACVAGLTPSPCEPTLSLLPSEIAGLPLPLEDLGIDVADGLVGIDLPPELSDVAVGADGVAFVADQGQGVVWRVDGDRVELFASFHDRVPGEGPSSVSVDRYGDLVVAVSARLVSAPPASPAIYSVPVVDGRAEKPRPPVELTVANAASDVAVGDSGRVYATVPARDAVMDVGMEQGDVIALDTRDADPGLARPDALDLTDGWLYVAGGPSAGGRWLVHRIGVSDLDPVVVTP